MLKKNHDSDLVLTIFDCPVLVNAAEKKFAQKKQLKQKSMKI